MTGCLICGMDRATGVHVQSLAAERDWLAGELEEARRVLADLVARGCDPCGDAAAFLEDPHETEDAA